MAPWVILLIGALLLAFVNSDRELAEEVSNTAGKMSL